MLSSYRQAILNAAAELAELARKGVLTFDVQRLLEDHHLYGGTTTDVARRGNLDAGARYIVSPLKSREQTLSVPLTASAVAWYIAANADQLCIPGRYLGTWRNPETGRDVLDVVQGVASLDVALTIARRENQKAIYDRQDGVSISVA